MDSVDEKYKDKILYYHSLKVKVYLKNIIFL